MLALLVGAAAGMPGNTAAAAAAAAATKPTGTADASAAIAQSAGADVSSSDMEDDKQQQQQVPTAAAATPGSSPVGGSDGLNGIYLSSEELLLPLLVAASDPYEVVSRRGNDMLIKIINPDAAKPAVDLEQPALVESLMKLMLGDQDPRAVAPAPTPAGPALAVRIMQLLVRSVTAARAFPAAPLVMSACLAGPSSSARLVRLGAEWTGWVFKHAEPHQLKAMAGPVLQRLLAALGLQEEGAADDSAAAEGAAGSMQVERVCL
eukprot:GHRR01020702.1.p1 GENE.GHRR01020702.1~~GHRR01020702.1.p1  ORF type:complete len:263 (+),score=132.79 GHRR01020702.1:1-789(+)